MIGILPTSDEPALLNRFDHVSWSLVVNCSIRPQSLRRIAFSSALMCVLMILSSLFVAPVNAADEASKTTLTVLEAFNAKAAQIEDHDAAGFYDLGMEMYESWNGKSSDLEPLELAIKAIKHADGVFRITLKDGSVETYFADDEGETWASIAEDYKALLEDTYSQIHARDKDADNRVRSVDKFDAKNRREVLHKAAANHAKAKDSENPPASIPVELMLPRAAKVYKLIKAEHADIMAKKNPDFWAMGFAVIGGLGLFLLGMKNLSEGIQAVAGQRMRKMINAVTDNRFMGVGVGTAVTCLVQSSSITTVIVVGLVNSGLMALHQALGVIMGANVGTTITGWILALKIGKYGLPILGIGVFVFLFSRKDRWRYLAMATFGLGLVFFGLEMMKNGFKPMKEVEAFKDAFLYFDAHTYFGVLKCALVGCLLTFIVQSSSATLGITIGLAAVGAIPFETAGALVLGENIGTTITAWLASIGTTTNAKRAAYGHVLFNIFGVLWITLIFNWVYVDLIGSLVESGYGVNPASADFNYDEFPNKGQYAVIITVGIALTHTIFNLVNTIIFLPFVSPFARLLERLIPDKGVKETPHLTSLDLRMVESPILAIENSHQELVKMTDGVEKMIAWTRELVQQSEPDEDLVQKVFHREKIMDNVQGEVIEFLTNVMTGEVPHSITEEGRAQFRIADEYESISDYVSAILKSHLRLCQNDLKITDEEQKHLLELHDMVADFVHVASQGFAEKQDILDRAKTMGKAITYRAKELREAHLTRLSTEKIDPILSMSYTAMINGYRKIRDHAINVAEAFVGSKPVKG